MSGRLGHMTMPLANARSMAWNTLIRECGSPIPRAVAPFLSWNQLL